MSTTRRTAILRARKNSEAEQDKRCTKRKKLSVPSSEPNDDRNTVNDSDCSMLSCSRNNKRSCQASKENMKFSGQPTSPVTPLDCSRVACTFTFTDGMKERLQNMTPLPELNWADSDEVWSVLKEKENEYPKNGLYMVQHPALQPKMRTILLDWLIEVCEVYRLHRETYHLAASYVDRYLKVKKNVQKSRLQLVGVTALFIAAKLEEIYPPKLSEFSYVTDGACTDDEILQEELIMLKTLDWKLTPVTLNTWLRIYLQLSNFPHDNSSDILVPDFSGKDYVQVAQLLDLCVLDLESAQFTNRILAAAAIYHTLQIDICLVAGIGWDELFACVQWMRPFSAVMKEHGPVGIRMFDKILPDDCPGIQTHGNTLSLLNKALTKKNEYLSIGRLSPPSPALGVLTPPSSTKKVGKIC